MAIKKISPKLFWGRKQSADKSVGGHKTLGNKKRISIAKVGVFILRKEHKS